MRILTLLLFIFLVACQSNSIKIETEASLADVKKAVTAAIGEPRFVSQNQREFTSIYFGRKSGSEGVEKLKERLYSHILILGSRRPYTIEIKVLVEEKVGSTYEHVGEDPSVAKKLKLDIEAKLQSRENRNFIDDFRPF